MPDESKDRLNFGRRTVEYNLGLLNAEVNEKGFRRHLFGLEQHGLLRTSDGWLWLLAEVEKALDKTWLQSWRCEVEGREL